MGVDTVDAVLVMGGLSALTSDRAGKGIVVLFLTMGGRSALTSVVP